jgi:nucleoside-diphosphate-sugar epimerase
MRFDLIVNTMYKTAMLEGRVTVNNASIWRPLLDIRDAIRGYLRAVQAHQSISGVFNLISDNYTVGAVGDMVKEGVEELTGNKIGIEIKNLQDFRNYKVNYQKARTVLGFEPKYTVMDMLADIHSHRESLGDLEQDNYYKIRRFRQLNLA